MNDKVKTLSEVAEDFRPIGKPIMTTVKEFDDAMDGGVRDGELITMSGPSGIGKTTYALWLTKEINDSGVPCLWFTYEMNPWYLKEKFEKMGGNPGKNFFVPIDHGGNSMEWILERISEAQEKYACKIIFIDHLHYLIPTSQEKNSSLLIGGVARKVKQLAIKTDCIIFLIAHMRRLGKDEKVSVDGIRDSALIANESDYVYLVERLQKKKKTGKLDDEDYDDTNIYTDYSRITLAKNRRTGQVFYKILSFDGKRFDVIENYKIKELSKNVEL